MNNNATGVPLNCGSIIGANAPLHVFKKKPIPSKRFRLIANDIERISDPGGTSFFNEQDRYVERTTGSTIIHDYEILVSYLVPDVDLTDDLVFTSSNESILEVPVNNLAVANSGGNVSIKATATTGEFDIVDINVIYHIGTTSDTFVNFISGSLARTISDDIDSRIATKDSSHKPIYSTQNHATSTYVRNANCWAADLDLTCISPWNSAGSNTRAGTLISPRHVLHAAHYPMYNGNTIRFVTQDNTVITRTITNVINHPSYVPYYPDIRIAVLDSDVPNTISFAKILPQDWADYLPSIGSNILNANVPALVLDQEEKALIAEWRSSSTLNSFIYPTNSQRLLFSESLIVGDSGNPSFLIIDGELVLLAVWTFGGGGSGTNIMLQKDAINSMMTTLGGGYQLTEIDLSGYPTY